LVLSNKIEQVLLDVDYLGSSISSIYKRNFNHLNLTFTEQEII